MIWQGMALPHKEGLFLQPGKKKRERGYALLAASLEPVLDRVLAGARSWYQPR